MPDKWDKFGNSEKEENIEKDMERLEEEYIEYDEYDELRYRRRKLLYRLTGFFVLIIFVTYALAGFVRVFTLPPLDFLDESSKLSQDPEIARLQKPVVQIKVDGGGVPGVSHSSRGSGFNIDAKGLVVTNRHVVEDAGVVTVIFEEDGVYKASEVIKPSSDLDIAFLKLNDAEELPALTLKENPNLSEDEEVLVIGNPLGFSRVVKEGTLEDLVHISNNRSLLEIKAPIYPGSSGSPVFDRQGEVIGLIYAAREVSEDEVRGIAFSVREVLELLREEGIEVIKNN